MAHEWKVIVAQVAAGTTTASHAVPLEAELNRLDEDGFEIFALLPSRENQVVVVARRRGQSPTRRPAFAQQKPAKRQADRDVDRAKGYVRGVR